ncbi:hypothetical protein L1D14_04145 [Vibrio tubiashii]|uniref:hypothetical protein n=1 Tax=Vibrio tubiashii TaxID=29498 RepID=UPI001EFCCAD7|nr:hypothetical protein [Vibrio tubiashii]MCG9575422.1 hypothetical protein [Vibrio tubiashii]
MANIKLEVTQVRDSGNEFMEADEVRFKVISGEPTEQEISDYLTANATAVTNLSYCKDDKSGMFIDLNFEFQKGKIVTFESTKA